MNAIPRHLLDWYRAQTGVPRLGRFVHVAVFDDYSAAERAARNVGLVSGSMQAGSPTALYLHADYVSKWRGLTTDDKAALDGMILYVGRDTRPVAVVTIRPLDAYRTVETVASE